LVETAIPARLDRLYWGRFHTLIVIALGITWVLDGLEVTLAGAVAGALKESPVLRLSNAEVGLASSFYLAGAVFGALFFGWLTDRLGRKRLFFVTLGVYLVATGATAFAWDFPSFALFRFLTGAGIGGEYTAIASAIQEFVPARYRGWTDLVINGSFWLGAALGAAGSIVLLNPDFLPPDYGWRAAFFIGSVLGLGILAMRSWIPESPRWLMIHGDPERAHEILDGIEDGHRRRGHDLPDEEELPTFRLHTRRYTPLAEVGTALFQAHRRRTLVGLSLMAAQAFFYNAIFFTYALVLIDFYGIGSGQVGWYLLPFAAGNFLGPVLLGRFFDTVGRRVMIAATYTLSGVLLALTGALFAAEVLSATAQTAAWTVIFFFASAAASSAYLTVSETFPLEIRALAIAFFYAVGTGIGGVGAP
jgi:MFS family permease